jgi:hypothetical protein
MAKLLYTFVSNQNKLVDHLESTGLKKLLKKMVATNNIEVQSIVKQNYQKQNIEIDDFEVQKVYSYTTSKEPIIFVHHLIKKNYIDSSRFLSTSYWINTKKYLDIFDAFSS